ncbi:MAG: hypothetical protein ACSHWW_02385 [Nonlabens sp.]|uniref:hypothetical protein n=1 Tax=Nonlabens sp. TaxID=1888209 RepID=UPI003EF17D43
MTKFFKYFQYAYLLFAGFFIVRGFYEFSDNPNMAYLLWVMAALVIFMYFFRKKYIGKFEDRNKKDDSQ